MKRPGPTLVVSARSGLGGHRVALGARLHGEAAVATQVPLAEDGVETVALLQGVDPAVAAVAAVVDELVGVDLLVVELLLVEEVPVLLVEDGLVEPFVDEGGVPAGVPVGTRREGGQYGSFLPWYTALRWLTEPSRRPNVSRSSWRGFGFCRVVVRAINYSFIGRMTAVNYSIA